MLFNYCVSNPPYQLDNQSANASRRSTTDIFPDYQMFANHISENTIMIYPATWQKSVIVGFGEYLVNHGMSYSYYYNSDDVFPNIQSGFPLSIVRCGKYCEPYISINDSIKLDRASKVWIDSPEKELLYFLTKDYPKLTSGAVSLNKLKNVQDSKVSFSSSAKDFSDPVKIYIKRKPGVQADASDYYMERHDYQKFELFEGSLDGYKVAIQSRTVGRTHLFNDLIRSGKVLNARIFEPDYGFANTYVELGRFSSLREAENFKKYVNSRFFLYLTSFDYSCSGYATFVPDLKNYSDNNSQVDWSKDITSIIQDYFNISDEYVDIIL